MTTAAHAAATKAARGKRPPPNSCHAWTNASRGWPTPVRARGGHELQRLHVTPERHHHGEIDGLCPVGSVGVAMRDRREGGHPPVNDRWNTACVEAGQP